MYSKHDEDSEIDIHSSCDNTDSLLFSKDFGSSKDIEKLLRVFIKRKTWFWVYKVFKVNKIKNSERIIPLRNKILVENN